MRIPRHGFILPVILAVTFSSYPQSGADPTTPPKQNSTGQQDPLKRTPSEKDRKRRQKALSEEDKHHQSWEKQDVKWIITDAERDAFHRLTNNEERDAFIELFWENRDPTPDTVENEYKDEHYRRITYANEHFSAGTPGSLTDRGHIYIAWGPPDEIESHPTGCLYNREIKEGGGSTSTYPFERWRYRHLETVGTEVILEFVDACMCNEYRLTMDPSEKDALRNVTGNDVGRARRPGMDDDQFANLDLNRKINSAPPVKFRQLAELVNTKVRLTNPMPFDVHTDFVKVTSDTVLVPVTVQFRNRDITFVNKDGVQRGTINLYGRVTTITGKIVQTFEDTVQVDVPEALFATSLENVSLYWKALPLPSKMYRLDIVAKDLNGDRVGVYGKSLVVPEFSEDKLASSSLILADVVQHVGRADIGSGNFVVGMTKVRPRVEGSDGTPSRFKRNEQLNLWMQVYNLEVDPKTRQPVATIRYEITNQQTGKNVFDATDSTSQWPNAGGQITLQKRLPLQTLPPGEYRVKIKISDAVSNRTIEPTARFVLE